MKTLFSFLLSAFIAIEIPAQTGTVTIKVKGNRITQIGVDNQYYTVNNNSTTGERTITLNSLSTGSHTLEIVRRSNNYSAATNSISTGFNLRAGYNLTITIAANGSVSQTETRITSGQAVSATVFNRILTQTRNRSGSSARTSYLENEFNNTNRRFTSGQARQLIQLVNSESMRLRLAKAVYPKITDPQHFSQVSSLLNSTASREELNEHIADYSDDDTDDVEGLPMNEDRFNRIYSEVTNEPTSSDRNYYLVNFFSRDLNYYTSAQVRQLIQLIDTEAERLHLAKLAYRNVTDKVNYTTVYSLLNSAASRSELQTYMSTFDNTGTRTAMSTSEFSQLYQSALYPSGNTARYNAVNSAFTKPGNYFSSTQARQLIQLVNDENSRLALAKVAYRVMVDRSNYSLLNDLFTLQTTRDAFRSYVMNFDGAYDNGNLRVPMSDADFRSMYRDVQYTFGLGAKMSELTRIFNNEANNFSVQQARALIQLVSAESNRLELAKSAYNNITDPANFSQLYDVLSSQSSKDELSAYIRSTYGQ